MANIKVAVRVRPISARELSLTGSEVVVRTEVNGISLTNLKVSSSKAGDSRERTRRYGFDYCFDSSDPEAENFADQARIYETLGQSVLDALFSGYNSCLVAYGQSASGKTYTMMGTKDDPGLTPRLCEGLFARIEDEARSEKIYRVSVSYLEIYNERVRDLLKPSSSTGGLRVREHPRLGPYVQGLTRYAVRNLGSLMSYVEEGARARRTASTLQNPSSSRSHALLTIAVTPETFSVVNGAVSSVSSPSTRRSEIPSRGGSKLRLVDLAGSENAATCSGVHRLKEGANINKSLVALGNVISALAERGSTGSGPGRRFIPYRDSSLTWLLKDALGGNATTIMLATISPASGSYNETAHTLRFAQRAQSVVNRPMVNEDPVARIIRELRAEVARLKSLLLEKSIEPDNKALCGCQLNRSTDPNVAKEQASKGEATCTVRSSSIEGSGESYEREKSPAKGTEEKLAEGKGCRSLVPIRKSNSSDSVTTCEAGTSIKRSFGSYELLATRDRFAGGYNRAKVTVLNDEEDEASELRESVFVDIPTLVAVLIKPDDNLQETSAQIEEICSDEVAEDPIDVEFVEATNDRQRFEVEDRVKPVSIDHDERSSSVNSCHASVDNESDVHRNPDDRSPANSITRVKTKPKFRKQDSVDVLSPVYTNLHTSKRFGSVETIQKKKEPIFSLRRSHTNLEKRYTVPDRAKRLNNIREIEDQKLCNGTNWRGSNEQPSRKGSDDSDKSSRTKSYARKPSLENLKRKTSKDSSSSSSKDEQILIPSVGRDKLSRRKNSLEQESPSIRTHTPVQRAKRAEIVAAVTERLYSTRKVADDVPEIRSPPENVSAKSTARMKLQEISRKMLGKRRRVCVDTQTECLQTVRLKDTGTSTEASRVICKDVAVLTDDHEVCEYEIDRKTPVLRVKEMATLTDKPRTSIVRCKDVASSVNDLDEFDYEIHSPRNDSGILSDDTQNYAESNLSSTEVSDLCQEAERSRAVYAESSTNTTVSSSCRSFAVQTPRPEGLDQHVTQSKAPACLRQCCNSLQRPRGRATTGNNERSVINISLPDFLSITIESTNALESRIATIDDDPLQEKLKKSNAKDVEAQTSDDHGNETLASKCLTRSILSQTDGGVFRIENIFHDPNNVSDDTKADLPADRIEGTGTGTRNSITFRNSLGTSYVSRPKHDEQIATEGNSLHGEGFIRDGLITEAFVTGKRGFHFRKAPCTTVYQDSWRNWPIAGPSVNAIHPVDRAKGLGVVSSSWRPRTNEIPTSSFASGPATENGPTFHQSRMRSDGIDVQGMSEMKSSPCPLTSNDHDHSFSDDSLDHNESDESTTKLKAKRTTGKRENLCPPDVVAHTKRDCSKSIDGDKVETIVALEDSHVEFPKKNPVEATDTGRTRDYESLILGRPRYSYEDVHEESDASSCHANASAKKKVSFSNDQGRGMIRSRAASSSKSSLKSIIKKRKKKASASIVRSSNEETDDSQQEEKISLTSENDWKEEVQWTSSEETFKDERNSTNSSKAFKQSRRRVKFLVEGSENDCTESDSCENANEEEEDVSLHCATRNILEEYLSEAVTFMRNLNSINEYVNGTSMLERNATFPSHERGEKRGGRRRSSSSSTFVRNRDYGEFMGRKVNPKEDTDDYPTANDDIVVSTDSYERCLKGIQRLEECIRRVDKHNELLREKYGVECESAGARLSLASPSTDPRVPTTSNGFTIPREPAVPFDKRLNVTEELASSRHGGRSNDRTNEEDDLEKRIFDQLMNVANSVGTSNGLRYSTLSDSRSCSPWGCSKFREKRDRTNKKPFCGDVSGSFSLEETLGGNCGQQDFTTFEITGNLSVERTRSTEDDNSDSSTDEDFLPLRGFDRICWSADAIGTEGRLRTDCLSPKTMKRDDSSEYNFFAKHETTSGARSIDNDDSSWKINPKYFPAQGSLTDNGRQRFQELEDYPRRIRNGGGPCGCSKDRSDVDSSTSEIAHLRDKLKYPGSPRARFLELLRERRRIVESSRGASAS